MTIGRLGVTALLAFKKVKVIHLYQGSIFIMGVSMLALALVKTYTFCIVFSVVFGAFDGIYVALFHVVVMTCVDPAQRPSAIGFVYFVNAGFSTGGPPLSGKEQLRIYLHVDGRSRVQCIFSILTSKPKALIQNGLHEKILFYLSVKTFFKSLHRSKSLPIFHIKKEISSAVKPVLRPPGLQLITSSKFRYFIFITQL